MIGILLWNFLVFVAGAVSMLVSVWWWMTSQNVEQILSEKSSFTETMLPDELVNKLKQEEGFHRRETCLSLNLILQFFFQEKRFEAGIMRWITNILTQEFNDLLKHRALSKFIHNMQIRDLNLGTNFPVIRAVTAKHVNLNPETSVLEQVDINVEVEYNGGIQLAIDASSRFSKAAMVKIKVVHLSGNGRLQFSRHPFTHWSFSFYDEPQVEFEVHSSLGLHIPRFNSVIVSQLRGILKRKHTLPYFKLRGAPLIRRHNQQINEEGCSVPPGRLTGSIIKCTRLQTSLVGEVMYCTVILSEVPIVCAVEKTSGLWVVQDISLKRPHGSSVGILLRNAEEGTQMVESVQQNSPAHLAGLRKNDIVLAVNGTYLNSGHQAAKLFSTCNINGDSNSITIRVKRLVHSEAKKILAEYRTVGSDASSAVVGEDASGDISGSGRSTPDSSHNNSPEMRRKLLDLHPLSTEARPPLLNHDKSPITSVGCKIIPRSVSSTAQDKSPCSTSGQIFPAPHQPTTEKPPSTNNSKAGIPTSSEILMNVINSEKRGLKKYGGKNKQIKLLQTPFIDGTCEPVFDSDFEFWLEEENKYMCIAVWSRSISNSKENFDSLSSEKLKEERERCRSKDSEKERKKSQDHEKAKTVCENVTGGLTDDILVGFINLPFISLIPETTLNTQGHVIKILNLTPPHPKCPEVASDPLISHKGFNPNLCYGDVMISLTYQPQDRCDVFGRVVLEKNGLSEDESMTDGTLSEDDDVPTIQEVAEDRNHDFKRTHFHSATHCNFCRKKIWLKDAYQCSECGIICHKKCMVRCEQETVCDPSGLRYKDTPKGDGRESRESKETPEIITTITIAPDAENGSPGNTPPPSPQTQRRTLGSLFAQVASASKGSLKRAGSAHNLAPPNPSSGGTHSRSLPPSPPHSPHHSRKGSLTEASNPFLFDQDVGDNIQEALDRLLLFPHDERLVTLARESAKNLHSYVPVEERREKINSTLAQLQTAVDSEGEVRVDLARQEKEANETGNNISRAAIALQISQCDARTQALALLTLHYCTALQHCNTDSKNDDDGLQKGQNNEPGFLEEARCDHLLPKPTEE
ncbi:PDZ domain-containing protein 8-like isoform X9 [Portunus trituberculatus]|uniref:PDZ domain-containing protein 8-like isoform X9 n=1 Tax=Portunus trituberculatus TaxID=210409 RepID=UPI001E1CD202|nr:PDZ domain-containing protein 8-like isoform X9 [Portunus trituberculatus]